MTFKERAREEAGIYAVVSGQYYAFVDGAEWGMRQAIEALRTDAIKTKMYLADTGPDQWADWLLEKVGMDEHE